jgi:hypothetical protein
MKCPHCATPLPPSPVACDACTLKIAFDRVGNPVPVYPEIRPGEVVWARDFRRWALPSIKGRVFSWSNGDATEGTPQGVLVTKREPGLLHFAQPFLAMRDGVVRASFIAYDQFSEVTVTARSLRIGDVFVRYHLSIRPNARDFGILRYCSRDGGQFVRNRQQHPAIVGLGYPNVVEFRFQGPTLQAWINGQMAAAVHDLAILTGQVGIAVGTSQAPKGCAPQRAMCEWFEIRTTAA